MTRVLRPAAAMFLVAAILSPAGGKLERKRLTFAYIPASSDPFMQMIEKGAAAKARELGIKLVTSPYPSSWDPDVQVPILDATVAQGRIDLLLVVPASAQALQEPLRRINDKGIPMVTCETCIGDANYAKPSDYSFPLAHIGTDNERGGYEVGKRLAVLVGDSGKVSLSAASPDAPGEKSREEGFLRAMKEHLDIRIVGVDYNLDSQEKAQAQTAAVLRANPDLKGIFCTSLRAARGASQAAAAAGLRRSITIAAWDASPDLIQALREGAVDLVLAPRAREIGQLAVEWGYRYLVRRETIPKVLRPGFSLFTRENLDTAEARQFFSGKR
jgi:ribose transport system substrate-binding protein